MAEEFIEDIYKNSKLLLSLKKMEEGCRKKKYNAFRERWKENADIMVELCRNTALIDEQLGINIWTMLQETKKEVERGRYNIVADLLSEVRNYIQEAIALQGNIDVSEENCRLFSTRSGFLNVELLDSDRILYSNIDPAWDRYMLAKALYIPTMKHFFVLGCGLGYLPWQMYEVANEGIDIHILDIDSTMVGYAKDFGALSYIPEDKLHITVGEDVFEVISEGTKIIDDLDESEVVFYIEDHFFSILSDDEKMMLDILDSPTKSWLDLGIISEQNYYRNHAAVKKTISDIAWENFSKEWIIVGGGPSFDENIEYLKDNKNKKTIIAASTIFGRMLAHNIEPDIVVVIDPQKRTYGHMKDVNNHNPILIISENAYWEFAEQYQGETYIAITAGNFYTKHEREARDKLSIQGTVSAFAIEIAAFAGAERIELVGVDLSFPNGNSHAEGTMDAHKVDCTNLYKVPAVDGTEVYTDSLFKMYIDDMERLIEQYKEIEFYNMSKHGALIQGCKK